MRRVVTLSLAITVSGACGGGSQVETEPAATSADAIVSCGVAAPGTEGWKLVDAGDYTFCVPAEWRVREGRATHGGTDVRWRSGARVETRVPLVVGRVNSREAIPRRPGPGAVSARESIGGREARLWSVPGNPRYQTGVDFTEPAMHFTGEAADERLADVHLRVYRTIRFPAR